MQRIRKRGEKLGLTDDEVAFYDALAANESAVQVMGDAKLKVIATELISKVRTSVTGVDPIWWTVSLRCFLHGLYQLEFDRAVVIERRVAAARVVEAVDVFAN